MCQRQPCLIAVSEQLKRDPRIAGFTFIAPGVGDLLLRDHRRDFAEMMVSVPFVLDDEFKLESDLGSEFLQIEIPLAHLSDIGERAPHSRHGRVEGSFQDDRFC